MFSFNVGAIWRICKLIIPQMRELGRGSVVLFSSTAGLQASNDVPIYSVTNAAVVMMTRTLALNHATEISAQTVSAPEPSPARWPRPASPSPGEKLHRSSAGRRSSLRIRWAGWGCRPRWRQLSAICWTMRRASPSAPRLRSTEAALPKLRFDRKTVVVTGAARGIGAATAAWLGSEEAWVLLASGCSG
jgi:NAD(P)-dependent dehydrogenase (short-subunit alcohol dehydrogenase family)